MNTLNWIKHQAKALFVYSPDIFAFCIKVKEKNQIHKAEQIDKERNGGLEMLKLFIDS